MIFRLLVFLSLIATCVASEWSGFEDTGSMSSQSSKLSSRFSQKSFSSVGPNDSRTLELVPLKEDDSGLALHAPEICSIGEHKDHPDNFEDVALNLNT
ncbi:hypothetical protein PCASD_26143, partial [Puccinia coronata f. sp. avenae]